MNVKKILKSIDDLSIDNVKEILEKCKNIAEKDKKTH